MSEKKRWSKGQKTRESLTAGVSPEAIESWMNTADPQARRLTAPHPSTAAAGNTSSSSADHPGEARRLTAQPTALTAQPEADEIDSLVAQRESLLVAGENGDPVESWMMKNTEPGVPPPVAAAPEPDEIEGPGNQEEVLTATDPANPRNWSASRKWLLLVVLVAVDLTVGFAAAGFGPAIAAFRVEFNVSDEVGVLGVALYLLGLALGPLAWAPMSEVCIDSRNMETDD